MMPDLMALAIDVLRKILQTNSSPASAQIHKRPPSLPPSSALPQSSHYAAPACSHPALHLSTLPTPSAILFPQTPQPPYPPSPAPHPAPSLQSAAPTPSTKPAVAARPLVSAGHPRSTPPLYKSLSRTRVPTCGFSPPPALILFVYSRNRGLGRCRCTCYESGGTAVLQLATKLRRRSGIEGSGRACCRLRQGSGGSFRG